MRGIWAFLLVGLGVLWLLGCDTRRERRHDNKERYLLTTLLIDPRPDMIGVVQESPTVVKLNEKSTFRALVQNYGAGFFQSFRCGVYTSQNSNVTTSDSLVATYNIAGMTAGQSVLLPDTSITNNAVGTFFTAIIVDDQNVVTERNEANNTAVGPAVVTQP